MYFEQLGYWAFGLDESDSGKAVMSTAMKRWVP
jgi:hypothetical protein